MDILFSKDGFSYTHNELEQLCKSICKERNIFYKEYKLKLETIMIYNTEGVFSYLILFEDLKELCFKYGIDLMVNVDSKKDRIMDKTGTIFYTKDIIELGYAIAKYYNLRLTHYKRYSNDSLTYYLRNDDEKYTYSFCIRYFSDEVDSYINGNYDLYRHTSLIKK